MKNKITEMKNTLEGINCRLNDTKECISELKDRVVETTHTEKKKGRKRNENSLKDLCKNIKHTNICIIGDPEEEEREMEAENITEDIIHENFPNLG